VVDSNYRGWIDVNVTNIVSEWTRSWSADHHGLFLRVSSTAEPGNVLSVIITVVIIINLLSLSSSVVGGSIVYTP